MPKDFLPQYDVALSWSSTNLGLMLAEYEGKKGYKSYYARPLGESLITGSPSEANFPPEQEIYLSQKEFHAGAGSLNFYNKRYGQTNGVDCRVRGKVKLAPAEQAATVTLQSALDTSNFSNMLFETWTDATTLDNWTKGGTATVATNRSTDKQGGTYACNLEQYDLDDFTSDQYTDVGSKVLVDAVTDFRVEFEAENSATDNRCHRDMTSFPDTAWSAKFDIRFTGGATSGRVNIGAFSATENPSGMAGDAIMMRASYQADNTVDVIMESIDGGAGDATTAAITDLALNTTYYLTVERTSATGMSLSVYTDSARTTHIAGSPQTAVIANTVATLRYFQFTNHNSGAGAAQEIIGWADNLALRGCTQAGDLSIYQDLSTWGAYYNNKAATFTCYAKTSLASNLRIGIDDGGTPSYSSYHTGGGAYENLTVTYTPVAAGTKLRLVVERKSTTYASGDVVDTATFAQPAASRGAPILKPFIFYDDTYYYLENKTIFSLSGTTFTEVYTFEDAIVDVEKHGGYLIVTVGTGDFYYYTSDGTTYSRSATAEHKMGYLERIIGNIWGSSSAYQVKSCDDPTNAVNDWSTATDIGTSDSDINSLAEYNQTLFIGKEDGVFYIDSSGNDQPIAPELKTRFNANNCKGMKPWQDSLWIPLNDGLLNYYYGTYGILTDISPKVYMTAFPDYHERVMSITGDMNWLYVATDANTATSSKTPILAVRRESIGDVEIEDDFRWQTLINIDQDEVYGMDVYSDKLWIAGTKSGTASVKYLSLADDDYPTSGTQTMITSWYDFGFAGVYKSFHSFELQSENLTANIKVKVEFQIDDGSFTEIVGAGSGSFTSSVVTSSVKYFQADSYGRKIRFRFTLSTNSASTSPHILGFIVRGALRPNVLRVQEWWVKCADRIILKNSRPDTMLGSKIKSNIATALAQVWPITIYDIWGNSMSGFIKAPSPEEEPTNETDYSDSRQETTIHLILQETKLA